MSKPKLSVCFVSFAVYPLFKHNAPMIHGGAEVEIFYLSHEFIKFGYNVHIVTGNFGQNKKEKNDAIYLWRGIILKHSTFFRGIRNTLSLFHLWWKINADIYFTKGAGFLPFQLTLFCILFRKKCVLKTSHKRNIDLSLRTQPYHRFYQWALRKAHAVIVQNTEDIEIIQKNYHIHALKIPNYQPIPHTQEIRIWNLRNHILWVGRLTQIKHPELFLEIAKYYHKERFLLIGSIVEEKIYQELKQATKSISNLTIITNVAHSEIDKYYKTAKLFISTSEGEGFPNTFIEALKWGVPIASLSVDPDTFLEKERVGFSGKNDFFSFREKIGHILERKDFLSHISHRANQYAQREFGMSVLEQWNKLFHTLLSS